MYIQIYKHKTGLGDLKNGKLKSYELLLQNNCLKSIVNSIDQIA